MDFLTFRNILSEFGLEIFTLNDAIKITGQSKNVIKSTLSRLAKQNKIFKIKKGYYSLEKIDNKFLLSKTFNDTYIGLNSALEYYQSTTQRFNNLDLITKKIKNTQKINDTKIRFHKVKDKMFFGYEKQTIGKNSIFISDVEKTVIDCCYFSSKIYLTEINDFIENMKNKIDKNKFKIYLNRIDSSALNKRAGYLLEKNGILIEGLRIDSKYEKLNINLSRKGIRNSQWKIIINEEL